MKRFLILTAALILSGWFLNATQVQATGCISGSLTGTCRATCLKNVQGQPDEIDGNLLINGYPEDFLPVGVCNQICCVAQGQAMCSHVSTLKTTPINKIGTWTCSKPCAGTALTTYTGLETCDADTICCDTAPVATPSASKPGGSSGSPITLTNPLGAGTTLFTVINRVISAFLGMVGALALGVFVYAGVTWMTAGSSDRVQKAKDAMKYAVIGLLMIAFSYAITNFLLNALIRDSAAQQQQGPEVQEAVPLGE